MSIDEFLTLQVFLQEIKPSNDAGNAPTEIDDLMS